MSIPPSHSEAAASIEQARWLTEQVRPHESALRGYLRRQFPSIETDDVVQESYLKLLKAKTRGQVSSVKAYFFSVARNTALTLFRRNQIYSHIPVTKLPDWRVLDEGTNAAETTNIHQRFDLVVEAIDGLPTRCREIVTLAALQGFSNAEIAAKLGLSENTVRVQIARGLKKCVDYVRTRGERA